MHCSAAVKIWWGKTGISLKTSLVLEGGEGEIINMTDVLCISNLGHGHVGLF